MRNDLYGAVLKGVSRCEPNLKRPSGAAGNVRLQQWFAGRINTVELCFRQIRGKGKWFGRGVSVSILWMTCVRLADHERTERRIQDPNWCLWVWSGSD